MVDVNTALLLPEWIQQSDEYIDEFYMLRKKRKAS